jgi:hypothetical protein
MSTENNNNIQESLDICAKYKQLLEKNSNRTKEYLKNLKDTDIDKFREINRLKSQRYRESHKNDEEYKNKCKEYQKNMRNKKKLEFLYHDNIIKKSLENNIIVNT